MADLKWQLPEIPPDEIVKRYVNLVTGIPGPIQVWARVEGTTVYFFTVIDQTRESELAVYEAERKLLQTTAPGLVSFDVHRAAKPLNEEGSTALAETRDAQLVLSA